MKSPTRRRGNPEKLTVTNTAVAEVTKIDVISGFHVMWKKEKKKKKKKRQVGSEGTMARKVSYQGKKKKRRKRRKLRKEFILKNKI